MQLFSHHADILASIPDIAELQDEVQKHLKQIGFVPNDVERPDVRDAGNADS